MIRPHRQQPLWWAFALHRVSGLALTLFLPIHFLVLGTALEGEAALDGVLVWTEGGAVKFAEMGLVFLLAIHLLGGLRILAIEFLRWRDWQATLAAVAGGLSAVIAFAFLFQAI